MVPVTKISEEDFDYIIHLSDLHIRPTERHVEYEQVFVKLYRSIEQLKKEGKKAVIVITGDIFDNKNRFSPAQYDLCNQFFDNLCNLYPLIVILGNHDMKDPSIIDSITPSAYKRNNFYYLLESGAYEYGPVVFVVSSLYHPDNYLIKRSEVATTKLCLALYHGTISGSRNDEDYVFVNDASKLRFRRKEDFAGYDGILLGDIHKMQSLSDNMWYSGSLIQQNYGEKMRGHGYLLWKIKGKMEVEFREIINDYGLVTLIIEDGIWKNESVELPLYASIRCLVKNTTESKVEEIIQKIGAKVEEWYIIYNDVIKVSELTNEVENEKDPVVNELKQIKDERSKRMVEIHENYMKSIERVDSNKKYLWYLKSLKFKNVFCYRGKENLINFKSGVTSVTGTNYSGKTSLINTIVYGLYGELLLKRTRNIDILSTYEDEGYVILEFCHGGTNYTVERILKRQKNNLRNPIKVTCKLTKDGQEIKERDQKLRELLGPIENFHRCNVLNDTDASNDFFNLPNDKKLEYLKNIFDLNYMTDLVDQVKLDLTKLKEKINYKKGEHNIVNTNLKDVNLESDNELKTEIQSLINHEKCLGEELNRLKKERDHVLNCKIKKESELVKIYETTKDLEKLIKNAFEKYHSFDQEYDVNELKMEIKLREKQLDSSVKESKEMLEKEINKIKGLNESSLQMEEIYKQLCEYNAKVNNLEEIINKMKEELKQFKNIKVKVDKAEPELEEEIKKFQTEYKNIKKHTKVTIKEKIIKLDHKIKKYKNCEENDNLNHYLVELEKSQNKYNLIKTELNEKEKEVARMKIPKKECDCDRAIIIEKITELMSSLKMNIMLPLKKDIELDKYEENIKKLDSYAKKIYQLVSELNNLDVYLENLNSLESKTSIVKKEYENVKKTMLQPIKRKLELVNQLLIAIEEKNKLEVIVKNDEIIMGQNQVIDEMMKKDKNSKMNNQEILCQIEYYKYYEKEYEINELKERLEKERQKKISLEKNYRYNKILKKINNKKSIYADINENIKVDKKIEQCRKLLSKLKYDKLLGQLVEKEKEYHTIYQKKEETKIKYQKMSIVKKREEMEKKLNILIKNEKIQKEIYEYKKKLEYEMCRQNVLEYQKKIMVSQKNEVIKKELKEINSQYDVLELKCKDVNSEIREVVLRCSNLENRLKKICEDKKKLEEIMKEMNDLEQLKCDYENYYDLMGPKNLQTKIIKREFSNLVKTINEILPKYTKYSIDIVSDTNKKIIEIDVITKGKVLGMNVLSKSEKAILSIAFKRAINKYKKCTTSKILTIDESIDSLDKDNYELKLPTLLKEIMDEYSYIILISQRDTHHIDVNELKVIKVSNEESHVVT